LFLKSQKPFAFGFFIAVNLRIKRYSSLPAFFFITKIYCLQQAGVKTSLRRRYGNDDCGLAPTVTVSGGQSLPKKINFPD